MKILSSDTSTKSLSVAICEGNEIIINYTIQTGTTHSQTYMPAVLKIMQEACLQFSDIDLFVCTTGPGSYTGIRIGVSTTKAMAYAAKKGAVGISTLETLAFPHNGNGILVCPMLDARSHRVFSCAFSSGTIVMPEANRTLDEFLSGIADYMKNEGTPCLELIFCGDGVGIYQNDDDMSGFANGIKCPISFKPTVPEAADAAKIAYMKYCHDDPKITSDPFLLKANYISPSQAERNRDKGRDKGTVLPSRLTPGNVTEESPPCLTVTEEPSPCPISILSVSEEPSHCLAPCLVRQAKHQDLSEIYELEKECFSMPWSFESLEKDITSNKNSTYLTAVLNGRIIGYIGMWQIFEDAEITNLAVSKDFRRKGIGNRLIREICSVAEKKGATRILLEVRQTNKAAIDLYISNDFKRISIRKCYYKDTGEDAIIMLKNLKVDFK